MVLIEPLRKFFLNRLYLVFVAYIFLYWNIHAVDPEWSINIRCIGCVQMLGIIKPNLMRRILSCFILLLMLSRVVVGQKTDHNRAELTTVYHSPQALQNELTYLFERIEAIHINPFSVTSKAEIYRQIQLAKSQLTKPMNSLEF